MARTSGANATGVVEASIDELSMALASSQTTSVELVAAYLNRLAAYDRRGPRLNSTPIINPNVFAEAAAADRARQEHGGPMNPLHGIPFTVKDSFSVVSLPLAAGSPAFADLTASRDAFVVERLRGAGAVVLGKTNMPPMAVGGCQRGLYGRAESPYNPDYLPAAWHSGSSSGSGVAVSASLCAFGVGEETVSSGRSPASNGGLVAYTPSRGLVSNRGNWPLFGLRDTVVPHTRTVADMRAVADVLVVDDDAPAGDVWKSQPWVELPRPQDVRPASGFASLAPGMGSRPLQGIRFGLPKMYVGADEEIASPIDIRPSIKKLTDESVELLVRLGAECILVDLPAVSEYEKDRPGTRSLVDRGLIPAGWNSLEINDVVSASWEEFLRLNADPRHSTLAVVNPWIIHADPPEAVDTRRDGVAHEGQDQIRYGYIVQRAASSSSASFDKPRTPLSFPDLPKVLQGLEQARETLFESWLSSYSPPLDGVIFPANCDIAPSNADVDPTASSRAWQNGTVFSNMNHVMRHLGIPSLTVSMGIMPDTGIPVGLTFATRAYADAQLFRWAGEFEQTRNGRKAPDGFGELATSQFAASVPADVAEERHLSADFSRSLSVQVTGDANIDITGRASLDINVTITRRSLEQSRPLPLLSSVTLVVDGTRKFEFEKVSSTETDIFRQSLVIPATERRGARFQSSLVVATGVLYCRGEDGQLKRLATVGAYAEIGYRYP